MTAADPAACPDCEAFAEDISTESWKHLHWCHERIRALEAEVYDFHAVAASPAEVMEYVARALRAEARVAAMEKALCDHCGKRWYMFDEFEAREREEC